MRLLPAIALSLIALPVVAGERENLIASIVVAGTNETAKERHTVEINDCQMTTYRWRNVEGEGWVLWTSFVFAMADADLIVREKDGNQLFLSIDAPGPNGSTELSIISWKMKDGLFARHEKSMLRTRKPDTDPSPRGDGTTHFYQMQDDFFILQEGPGVHDKAHRFTQGYTAYVQRYCTFIG